jgi:hypothetical protein
LRNALLLGIAIVVWVAVFAVYWTLRGLGFPDGHLTELDRTAKILGQLFIWASIPFALYCSVFPVTKPGPRAIKRFSIVSAVYAIAVLGLIGLRIHYGMTLDHGRGG